MTRRPNHHALALTPQPRRGVALILVVAVLGILFVAGAALLSQVTFSTKTLDAERQARQNDAAIAAMEELALNFLTKGFIGTNGQAYSSPSRLVAHRRGQPDVPCAGGSPPDPDCELALPTYSEVPGLHPWLDVTEPINTDLFGGYTPEYKLFSSMDFAIANRPGLYRATSANSWIDLRDPTNGVGIAQELDQRLPRDADGDGIPDTVDFPITDEMLPPDLQRALAERISDDAYRLSPTGLSEPVRLWGSLKIIPHGAMADVNAAHQKILSRVLGLGLFDQWTLTGGNLPQSNEWWLRSRGPLLPRSLPQTRLVNELGPRLLQPFASPFQSGMNMAQLAGPGQRRWWTFDPMTEVATNWSTLMLAPTDPSYPPDRERYDVSHNLTTVSYDDLLMRPVRKFTPDGFVDAIDFMRADEDAQYNPGDVFALDNYPYSLDVAGDRLLLGRLQVSIPEMNFALPGGLSDWSMVPPDDRRRFVRTFQDAFLLMLSNHRDFNRDGVVNDAVDSLERSITAAMLTANLIDFADLDNEPFGVPVIDTNGVAVELVPGSPLVVYGFERQPFITGIYLRPVAASPATPKIIDETRSSFAVELYNPYDVPIPLAGYFLTDVTPGATKYNLPTGTVGRMNDVDLSEDTSVSFIGARSFVTIFAFEDPIALGGDALQLGGQWAIDVNSVIRLQRLVEGGTVLLTVDEFNITADVNIAGSIPDPDPLPNELGILWERDTSIWPVGIGDQGIPRTKWLFPVPVAGQTVEATGTTHTLGEVGPPVTLPTPGEFIMPVHADVMNSGTLVSAFPTTGSLLLIMRYAHLVDPNGGNPISMPFNRISTPYLSRNMKTEFDRLENGHMPVFDFEVDPGRSLPRHRDASAYGVLGVVEGLESLPWGQLIFDYFTGLPVDQCEPCDSMQTCFCPWYRSPNPDDPEADTRPWVDQGGLRVRGRININAAPWVVLAGVPFNKIENYATSFQPEMLFAVDKPDPTEMLYLNDLDVAGSNVTLAQAIVAYREARDSNVGYFEAARDPFGNPSSAFAPRRGRGFLTIGELANVSDVSLMDGRRYCMDSGANSAVANQPGSRLASYVPAVTRLVTLSEWLTTKSHVFTVYGVIRGQHERGNLNSLRQADSKALRFQTTVNRLPMFFGRSRPERIGTRISGGYAEVRSE